MISVEIFYGMPQIAAPELWEPVLLLQKEAADLAVTDALQLLPGNVTPDLPRDCDMAELQLLTVPESTAPKALLIAGFAALTPQVMLFAVLLIVALFSLFILIRNIRNLRQQSETMIREQGMLVNDLEQTIQQLEASKEEAHEHQLFMRRLSMVLTHDLQSPFRFLIANTEALHQHLLNEEYEESAALSLELKASGEKTLRFLMDFTLWMKSISDVYKQKHERVNVAEVFGEVAAFFKEQLKHKHNTLEYYAAESIAISTDRELFKIVLRNLVDNANKYSQQGTIKLEAAIDKGYCVISITDNGAGMPADILEKIRTAIRNNNPYAMCSEAGGRQGYRFIAHFSRLLEMDLQVDSEPEIGTCIRLDRLTIAS